MGVGVGGGIHRTVKAAAERLFVQHCDPQLLAGSVCVGLPALLHISFTYTKVSQLRIGSCIHTQPQGQAAAAADTTESP